MFGIQETLGLSAVGNAQRYFRIGTYKPHHIVSVLGVEATPETCSFGEKAFAVKIACTYRAEW
tara:strand:- start:660 stop:848 length:189 start_codon:yes stop_codon:yes gene_type:complete